MNNNLYAKNTIRAMKAHGRFDDAWSETGLITLCNYLEENDMKTDDVVEIDCNWSEYDDLESMANDNGIDVSDWLDKEAIDDGLEVDDFQREIEEEIMRNGTVIGFNGGWVVGNV